MEKANYLTLSPYLRDGVFIITHNTGEMYLFINDIFIRKNDGLQYTYYEIPPIHIITKINYHFIAMGVNRWDKSWCRKHVRYMKGKLVEPPF